MTITLALTFTYELLFHTEILNMLSHISCASNFSLVNPRSPTPVATMSSIDEMLEHNRLLISTARATSNWAPTYEELRSNQASLIELVFTLVKDRATDVGSRHYIKLLEDSLKSAEQELRQERLEHDGSKVKIEQLEMRLRSTGAKVKHMSLAAKFHSVGIDKSVVGG